MDLTAGEYKVTVYTGDLLSGCKGASYYVFYTDYAKDKIKDMEPYISEAELIAKLRETSQSKTLIEKCGNPPLVSLNGIEDILESAKRGQCLSVSDLVSIENAITAFGRMKANLKRG